MRPRSWRSLDGFRNLLDVKRLLRNQDHVRAAGDRRLNGDPAGFAAHHFHHDHAVVRFRGGVNAVNGFSGDAYSRIKAKAKIGAAEVIVNRLGYGHHFDAAS